MLLAVVPSLRNFLPFLNGHLGNNREIAMANAIHYLDDFLLAGRPGTLDCTTLMSGFISICADLGVPLAQEKTIGPTTVLSFLGLEINTNNMTVQIPHDKLCQLNAELVSMLNKNKVTLKQLQKLTGLLNFCIRAIPSGRAFVRRLYDVTHDKRNHTIVVE